MRDVGSAEAYVNTTMPVAGGGGGGELLTTYSFLR